LSQNIKFQNHILTYYFGANFRKTFSKNRDDVEVQNMTQLNNTPSETSIFVHDIFYLINKLALLHHNLYRH